MLIPHAIAIDYWNPANTVGITCNYTEEALAQFLSEPAITVGINGNYTIENV